jgi:hypothetical protein
VETPDPATHARAYLQALVAVNVYEILWLLEAGELSCALIDGGVFSMPCTVPVDASSRWVAFEIHGGGEGAPVTEGRQVRWLTSADGRTWQEQASRAITVDPSLSRLNFGAGVEQAEIEPGTMKFDSFRLEVLSPSSP